MGILLEETWEVERIRNSSDEVSNASPKSPQTTGRGEKKQTKKSAALKIIKEIEWIELLSLSWKLEAFKKISTIILLWVLW